MEKYNIEITEEQFNKLQQGDRIEFRQQEDNIEKKWTPNLIFFIDLIIGMAAVFWLLAFLIINKLYSTETLRYFLHGSFNVFCLLFVLLMGAIIGDGFIELKRKKEINKLQDKYFKVEVKHRR